MIRIRVPALGHSLDSHTPLSMMFAMPLCLRHAEEVRINDFIDPKLSSEPNNLRHVVTTALRARGGADPDFDRAWVEPLSMTDPEWVGFEAEQRGGVQ